MALSEGHCDGCVGFSNRLIWMGGRRYCLGCHTERVKEFNAEAEQAAKDLKAAGEGTGVLALTQSDWERLKKGDLRIPKVAKGVEEYFRSFDRDECEKSHATEAQLSEIHLDLLTTTDELRDRQDRIERMLEGVLVSMGFVFVVLAVVALSVVGGGR